MTGMRCGALGIPLIILSFTLSSCLPETGTEGLSSEPRVFLRFAEGRSAEHPSASAAREFVRMIERDSTGAVRVRIHQGGRFGDDASILEQLRFGGIDLARIELRALEEISPVAARLGESGMFPDERAIRTAMDGEDGAALAQELSSERLVLLAWYDGGPDCFLLPRGHSGSPAGFRIGVAPSRSSMTLVERTGGTPVPLAVEEFRRAHEAGLVDGFRLPLITAGSERLADSFDVVPDPGSRSVEVLLASRVTFMQLLPSDRTVISRAAAASVRFQEDFRSSAEERLAAAAAAETGR